MHTRGRGNSRLTPAQVIEVYLLARAGPYSQREIAADFDISHSQVNLILHRKRWRWLFKREREQMSDDDLKAEIDKLKTRQAELEAKLAEAGKAREPAVPVKAAPRKAWDPTARASMSRGTMKDLGQAFPDDLVRALNADGRKPNPVTGASPAQLTPEDRQRGVTRVERGTGWAPPNPITPPAGISICDRIMDQADRQDRADLKARLARSKE